MGSYDAECRLFGISRARDKREDCAVVLHDIVARTRLDIPGVFLTELGETGILQLIFNCLYCEKVACGVVEPFEKFFNHVRFFYFLFNSFPL